MFREIKIFLAWRVVHETQCWLYEENAITGDRRATWLGAGYSPCNQHFIENATGNGYIHGPFVGNERS